MQEMLDEKFWNDRVPLMRELDALGGLQTSANRWARMKMGPGAFTNSFTIRQDFVSRYGFAVPCREMMEFVARHSKRLVEIGAGSGFLASQLRRFEIDVVATDLNAEAPEGETQYGFRVGAHHRVERMTALDAVQTYADRDVFCSWPSLDGSWLTEAAKTLQPGRLLFYVGEGDGGCTADDSFHELVGEESGQYEQVDFFGMVQFYGINDNLWVYRRLPVATGSTLIG